VLVELNFIHHKRTFLNWSKIRSTAKWYFPFKCSLSYPGTLDRFFCTSNLRYWMFTAPKV